jgi:hypothetical protein
MNYWHWMLSHLYVTNSLTFLLMRLTLEDECNTVLRNVSNYSLNNTASHARGPESSATAQNSHSLTPPKINSDMTTSVWSVFSRESNPVLCPIDSQFLFTWQGEICLLEMPPLQHVWHQISSKSDQLFFSWNIWMDSLCVHITDTAQNEHNKTSP